MTTRAQGRAYQTPHDDQSGTQLTAQRITPTRSLSRLFARRPQHPALSGPYVELKSICSGEHIAVILRVLPAYRCSLELRSLSKTPISFIYSSLPINNYVG